MLYLRYVKMNIYSLAQYRSSFIITFLSQIPGVLFSYVSMYILFDRFGNIKGYTFNEVLLCFSVTMIAFSVSECVARGFDSFSGLIKSGDFDRVLLRPRGTILQVLGWRFEITRASKIIYSAILLRIAVSGLDTVWDASKVFTLIFMTISGICIFSGVFILGATVCFFTVDGLEFINIFTDGGREFASYPLTIYAKPFVKLFTFIIPFGCMNYLPLLYLTGRTEAYKTFYMLSPLFGVIFLLPCIFVWNFGVKHYLSTGS